MQSRPADKGVIIYNITIQVEKQSAAGWLEWMLQDHIPEMLSTGHFINYQVVKLLDIDDSEALTYAIQLHAASKDKLHQFLQQDAERLGKKSNARWGNKLVSFSTTMQVVH